MVRAVADEVRFSSRSTRTPTMVAAHPRGLSTALCLALVLSLLLPLTPVPLGAPAHAIGAPDAIAPDLLLAMQREPLRLQPIIVEMRPLAAPFPSRSNEVLAQRALTLLGRYGRPIGALALISAAAGAANAAGITAIAQDPTVAFVHADATINAAATSTAADAPV